MIFQISIISEIAKERIYVVTHPHDAPRVTEFELQLELCQPKRLQHCRWHHQIAEKQDDELEAMEDREEYVLKRAFECLQNSWQHDLLSGTHHDLLTKDVNISSFVSKLLKTEILPFCRRISRSNRAESLDSGFTFGSEDLARKSRQRL